MSYFDLMSQDSYGRYNRKLAKLTSLSLAVYWSEVLDIIPHVLKKKTFDENGYFKLDRKYIEDRTCIQIEDQLNFDSILASIGVLEHDPGDCDRVLVRLELMEKLLIDDDAQPLDAPKSKLKLTKTEAAKNKKEAVIFTMKRLIKEEDTDLRTKYESLVDSIYSAGRFLTKVKIQTFENTINKFTSDKQVKSAILDLGIQTGWDNAEWLINKYTGQNSKSSATTLAPQKTSTGVSDKFEF